MKTYLVKIEFVVRTSSQTFYRTAQARTDEELTGVLQKFLEDYYGAGEGENLSYLTKRGEMVRVKNYREIEDASEVIRALNVN